MTFKDSAEILKGECGEPSAGGGIRAMCEVLPAPP